MQNDDVSDESSDSENSDSDEDESKIFSQTFNFLNSKSNYFF